MRFVLLLLVLSSVQFPNKTVSVDCLELNHYGKNQSQLISWEYRDGSPCHWPQDWSTRPEGTFDGRAWHDKNGKTIVAREYRETWTEHDPERRAFQWWRSQGETKTQGGVWK